MPRMGSMKQAHYFNTALLFCDDLSLVILGTLEGNFKHLATSRVLFRLRHTTTI